MINVNLIYPIGSIYISVNSKNPSEIFGGTWERIKGKMLIGVDEDDSNLNTSSKTGGEKEVTLTVGQIPPHYHETQTTNTPIDKANYEYIVRKYSYSSGFAFIRTETTGGGQPHNNMPPYFTCYIWYRTA